MGLLTPEEGSIYVDGVDIFSNDKIMLNWRSAIANVPQNIYLIDATIAENIALGVEKKNIDYSLVKYAARKAQISNFIENTQYGYESFVGERGVRISGGQCQRLGIARALYRKSKILIFDEATSALDNSTETSLINSINSLNSELTIIMIAHRLSTLRNCDKIINLENKI